MTGPSLSGVWERKAGSLQSYGRYSPALVASDLVWDDRTLSSWLQSPSQLVPGNYMTFAGIADEQTRADLTAFLHAVGQPGPGQPGIAIPSAYTATPLDLKKLDPERQVKSVRACRDGYFVTLATGKLRVFWDQSLRFETDSSTFGPLPGAPAILPAGMMGDRASIIFARPEEISSFIKHQC